MAHPAGETRPAAGPLQRLSRLASAAESVLLTLLLAAIVLLSTAQILLRNVFDTGIVWSDELVRILILWLAMAGAVAASRDGRHINIDVLSRLLPRGARPWAAAAVSLFTAVVCAVAAWSSALLVRDAYRYEEQLLGGVPAWLLQLVLPLGFALIALRYLLRAFRGDGEAPTVVGPR